MANTISTYTGRDKYLQAAFQQVLRKAVVAEKICAVDRSDLKRIQNPYASQPTATVTALTGTYTISDFTTTDDALTVDMEVKYAEHIMDFEAITSSFDIFANRMDELMYAVAYQIDYSVVNLLTEAGTGTYTTPAGGFATAANVNTIFANLISKVAGYAETYRGLFCVIEPTDLVGLTIAGATAGFTFADAVLRNGQVAQWMGVDVYCLAASTFADTTIGSTSVTNSGHRVFGVKGVSTYATPRGLKYYEKEVSGKTGKEIAVVGLLGFKLWAQKTGLIVDIALA
jgi:hypothetical protein